jgi:hypothetical protein
LRFIECRGISDPLATLFGGEGIDEHMRRADQALVHGRHGLDGQPFIDQGLVETAAKLGQGFGQHKMGLRTVESNVFYTTGRHDRHLGTQPLTDGFIGGTHFVFEHLQSQQHTHGNGAATAGRTLGNRLVKLCSMASTISAQGNESVHYGWNGFWERRRQPAGGDRYRRANAESGVSDAS